MGAEHLNRICLMDNIGLLYAVDTDLEKAKAFKEKYRAGYACADYTEAVRDAEVDIVIIATYPDSHLPIMRECIRYKKHVLCEKPIVSDFNDMDEMLSLASYAGSKVLFGYILRHNGTYRYVKKLIDDGVIGSPVVIRFTQNRHATDWARYSALLTAASSPLIDCGVHYVDVMEWFTGKRIVEVGGRGAVTESELPPGAYNYGLLTARLQDGSVGVYEAGWGNTFSTASVKEFTGTKGRIRIIMQKDRHDHQEEGDLVEVFRFPGKTCETYNSLCPYKPTDGQMAHLIGMIENNLPPVPSIDEVRRNMEAVFEADRQIKEALRQAGAAVIAGSTATRQSK